MNWVDGLILVALLIGAVTGYRRGFVALLVPLLGSLLSLILAFIYYRPLATWLDDRTGMSNAIAGFFSRYLGLTGEVAIDGLDNLLARLSLPHVIREAVVGAAAGLSPGSPAAAGAAGTVSHVLAVLLVSILAFFLLLFSLRLAFNLLGAGLGAVNSLPGISSLNRLAGSVLGLTYNALGILLTFGALTFVIPFLPAGPAASLARAIDGSIMASAFMTLFSRLILGRLGGWHL